MGWSDTFANRNKHDLCIISMENIKFNIPKKV